MAEEESSSPSPDASTSIVKLSFGTYGGAPPDRRWFGSGPTWKIPDNMTVKTLYELVKTEASRRNVKINLSDLVMAGFNPTEKDLNKTLKELGFRGGTIKIQNGAVD
jgi:hypothetical protein